MTLGQYGATLEERFADYCGQQHGVAVSSGTAALEIILRSLGVEGKQVLVPTNTFFATAAAVLHAGGQPVFMDTDPESFGTTPEAVERSITPNTVALIIVHIGGIVSRRLPEIQALATRRGLYLIEDASHAHGSSLANTPAGAFGIASAFSFYPTKVMTAAEGGMIVTNDPSLAERARQYRDQGKASFTQNTHVCLGYNWRLSEPHTIIGLRHFERLPMLLSARQQIAGIYDRAFTSWASRASLNCPQPVAAPADGISNYYKYILVLPQRIDRRALKMVVREHYQVSLAGEVYELPLHQQPVFTRYATQPLPIAEDLCRRHVCLPIFASMTEEQAQWVIHALQQSLT